MTKYKDMYYRLAGNVADAIDLLLAALQEGEDASTDIEAEIATLLRLKQSEDDEA